MVVVPHAFTANGEKVYMKCDWCELTAWRLKNFHDPRCPETCRNKDVGRAAWLRGQADARMRQHHSGDSYNGQYELGYEKGTMEVLLVWLHAMDRVITRDSLV